MDLLEDRLPRATASPSGATRSKKPNPVFFQRSSTFHHHQPSLLSPAKENCKVVNGGGGGGVPSPAKENCKVVNGGGAGPSSAAAAAKPFCKRLYEEPPPAESDPSVAYAFRRSASVANRSSKASPRWAATAHGPKDGTAAASWKGAFHAAALRVVLYSTSLRGIRRTYEDCCAVRSILRGFRVAVDERDVSLDASLRKELQSRLGCGGGGGKSPVTLPQVFVGDRWVGGAEEIRQLFESGELGKLLEGVPRQDPRFVCRACGGMRFVPCGGCSGSRKVFDEEEGQLRRCPDCNENGLVRCADCC